MSSSHRRRTVMVQQVPAWGHPMPMQMMPSHPMPGQPMPMQSATDGTDSMSEEERDALRERERNDKKGLYRRYQRIGTKKNGLLKKHKLEIVEDVTEDAITAARCILLSNCGMDQIVFTVTELPPDTMLTDLRARSIADLKKKLKVEALRLGSIVDEFNSNMSNTREVAIKYGWNPEWDSVDIAPKKKSLAKAPMQLFAPPPSLADTPAPLASAAQVVFCIWSLTVVSLCDAKIIYDQYTLYRSCHMLPQPRIG